MSDKEIRDESYEENMKRGVTLDAMVRTEGWKVIQGHFEERVKSFTNRLLIEEDQDIEKFENERQQIIGLRKLLLGIDSDIEFAKRENAKESS